MATARSLCCSATVSRPLTPERWNPSWLTPAVKGQLICTLTYYDGYLYTGYTSGGGGGTQATDGGYFCISTADENPSDGF